jgi:hypothetical protein
VLRFSVPSVASGSSVTCRYNVSALNADNINVNTFFRALDRLNALDSISIKMGALTDIGATAQRLSSLAMGAGVFINRYEITFSNNGPRDIESFGFGACISPPIGYLVRTDFAEGCRFPGAGQLCFSKDSGFGAPNFSAGPIRAGQRLRCQIETTGAENPGLSVIRSQSDRIRAADGRWLLDTNATNDQIQQQAPVLVQVPTLTGLGLLALVIGMALGARKA